jgi:hypothetical protein|tara:strand:+ start:3223 stop:3366 length:144 start_codon:yes stop_codon:yes gene_type:complete
MPEVKPPTLSIEKQLDYHINAIKELLQDKDDSAVLDLISKMKWPHYS